MNWIKQNYDQFILGLVALLLLLLSGYLIWNAMGFPQTFAGIQQTVIQRSDVPKVDMTSIQNAGDAVQNPGRWELDPNQGSLFISIPYIAQGNDLIDPRKSNVKLHPPIPNKWIIDHKLDILDNNVLNEDPDGDGFTNLEEYLNLKGDGSDATDPNDKTSHPPYYTKLKLVRYIKIPFRLKFETYDGDPKKPETLNFQINTLDLRQPSQFLKIGDIIVGTKFKIISFEPKHRVNGGTGGDEDISELTIQRTDTGDNVVMVLEQTVDSPDSYAQFKYLWNNTQFTVKKNQQFVLMPETTLKYKLIDISDREALIQTPTGQQVKVPLLSQ